MGSYGCSFLFGDNPFLKPFDRLPALKLDKYFVGVDILVKVEEDAAVDGIACDVERPVNLYEDVCHT